MIRTFFLGLMLAAVTGLTGIEVHASGSFGPGAQLTTRGAYTLGKAITFRELVCRRNCPIQRREFNRSRAMSLSDSLSAAFKDVKPGTPDDDNIKVLCSSNDQGCAIKLELVQHYLTRRFRL